MGLRVDQTFRNQGGNELRLVFTEGSNTATLYFNPVNDTRVTMHMTTEAMDELCERYLYVRQWDNGRRK
jgi:hypothetical protein